MKTIKIGITGGIGSGKTTVGNFLKARGYAVYDCDEIARELMETENIQTAVRKTFGESFFKEGNLDRRALGDYVFTNGKRTQKLNAIFHGAVAQRVWEILRVCNDKIVFVIAPLLFEAEMNEMFDECWVVAADEKKQTERTMLRDNMNEDQILNRMARQMSFNDRLALADKIINNNGTLSDLEAETYDTLAEALKPKPTIGDTGFRRRSLLMPSFMSGEANGEDDEEE